MQQAMRVKGVVNPAPATGFEGKTHLGTTLANGLAHLGLLFGGGSVLFGNVFAQVLAAHRHVGVELEGLEMQFSVYLGRQTLERALKGA